MRTWLSLAFLAITGVVLLAAASSAGLGVRLLDLAPRVDGACASVDTASGQPAHAPSADLYCIELFPGAGIEGARGFAEMAPPSSPFGTAVTPEGVHEYDLRLAAEGLAEPATLGPYTTYVAWATTLQLYPFVKLGVLRDGRLDGARIAFDQFLVLVSAEASADVTEREGRLVLRGLSPSTRLQPHDLPFVLAGMLDRDDSAEANAPAAQAGEHAAHAGHGPRAAHGTPDPGGWTPPPMHPQVSMPEAMMTLRPDAAPYRVTDPGDAPLARPRETVRLADGDTFDLVAAPVRRAAGEVEQLMLAFNGQIPGPLIDVDQNAEVVIRFTNRTDFPTAIHWHGIRLDNRFDGVPHLTQALVATGERFTYRVRFPDAGLYWYHPHHREDVLQDLGLAGNLHVRPRDDDWLGPANREAVLMLDDLLV
ncbi:MAG: multicopper oxidase domain-containing protein, partial [Longimicrobiales bacterium]